MEETISLKELYEILKKRLGLILLLTIAAAIVSAVISYFIMTPIYHVSTQILVNRSIDGENYNPNEVQTNIQLINTYSGIITSPRILDIVSENLNGKYTTAQLQEKITVESQDNSQIISVVVEDPDPHEAAKIANETADVFHDEIKQIMNVDNVSILTPAEVTKDLSPVKPKPMLNIAIAIVIGLMAGTGIAFLIEYFDNTVKTEQDIEKYLEIPVLGVISNFEMQNWAEANLRGRGGLKHAGKKK